MIETKCSKTGSNNCLCGKEELAAGRVRRPIATGGSNEASLVKQTPVLPKAPSVSPTLPMSMEKRPVLPTATQSQNSIVTNVAPEPKSAAIVPSDTRAKSTTARVQTPVINKEVSTFQQAAIRVETSRAVESPVSRQTKAVESKEHDRDLVREAPQTMRAQSAPRSIDQSSAPIRLNGISAAQCNDSVTITRDALVQAVSSYKTLRTQTAQDNRHEDSRRGSLPSALPEAVIIQNNGSHRITGEEKIQSYGTPRKEDEKIQPSLIVRAPPFEEHAKSTIQYTRQGNEAAATSSTIRRKVSETPSTRTTLSHQQSGLHPEIREERTAVMNRELLSFHLQDTPQRIEIKLTLQSNNALHPQFGEKDSNTLPQKFVRRDHSIPIPEKINTRDGSSVPTQRGIKREVTYARGENTSELSRFTLTTTQTLSQNLPHQKAIVHSKPSKSNSGATISAPIVSATTVQPKKILAPPLVQPLKSAMPALREHIQSATQNASSLIINNKNHALEVKEKIVNKTAEGMTSLQGKIVRNDLTEFIAFLIASFKKLKIYKLIAGVFLSSKRDFELSEEESDLKNKEEYTGVLNKKEDRNEDALPEVTNMQETITFEKAV